MALLAPAHDWFVTEGLLTALWAPECTFTDPVMALKSRERFINHCRLMDEYGKVDSIVIVASVWEEASRTGAQRPARRWRPGSAAASPAPAAAQAWRQGGWCTGSTTSTR